MNINPTCPKSTFLSIGLKNATCLSFIALFFFNNSDLTYGVSPGMFHPDVCVKTHLVHIFVYLHLPSIFPIKCVGGPGAFMSVVALLCKSAQRHLYHSA